MCAAMGIVTDGSIARSATLRRRFQLFDAMILIAATAIGCGVMLAISREANRSPYDWCLELIDQEPFYEPLFGIEKFLILSLLTMPLVATVTMALIPIRLVGARTRFARLACQPGLVASRAVSVAIAFLGLPAAVGALAAGASWSYVLKLLAAEENLWSVTMSGGLAVLVSWMTLYVGRRWRSERSSVDRLGRGIGLYWIVAAFAVWTALFLIDMTSQPFSITPNTPTLISASGRETQHLATVIMPPLGILSLALIPIRLVGPQASLRRLARQPGLLASFASGVAIALIGINFVFYLIAAGLLADGGIRWEDLSNVPAWLLNETMMTVVARNGGLAVLVSWMTLFVGGQWRAEPKWTDRLGRAIGFCWILAAFAVASGSVLLWTDYDRHNHLRAENSPTTVSDAMP